MSGQAYVDMNRQSTRLARLLVWLAALLSVSTLVVVSLIAVQETRESMTSVRVLEARAAARAIRNDLDRAVAFGIPVGQLVGMSEYLQERAVRLPQLQIFALAGTDGQYLFHAGLEGARLDGILKHPALQSQLPKYSGISPPLTIDGIVVVLEPLGDDSGVVLVGIEPTLITEALARDIWRMVLSLLGSVILVIAWTSIAFRAGWVEPAALLDSLLTAGAQGHFDRLAARRSRDVSGHCLLSFNAVVASLHARRQAFVAQAEEVCHAVFDPTVANSVVCVQQQVLEHLGSGLALPPQRYADPRSSDTDLWVTTVMAAASMGVAGAIQMSGHWIWGTLTAILGVILGMLAGRGGGRRWFEIGVSSSLFLLAIIGTAYASSIVTIALVWAVVVGVSAGAAAHAAASNRRQVIEQGGVSGRGWGAIVGVLAGAMMVLGVAGDLVMTGLGSALLALAAMVFALSQGTRK